MWWIPIEKRLPKRNSWYQCTILYKLSSMSADDNKHEYATYVMDLFYISESKKWVDYRRENDSHLFDRTSQVVAWQKQPRPYFKKGVNYHTQKR